MNSLYRKKPDCEVRRAPMKRIVVAVRECINATGGQKWLGGVKIHLAKLMGKQGPKASTNLMCSHASLERE